MSENYNVLSDEKRKIIYTQLTGPGGYPPDKAREIIDVATHAANEALDRLQSVAIVDPDPITAAQTVTLAAQLAANAMNTQISIVLAALIAKGVIPKSVKL